MNDISIQGNTLLDSGDNRVQTSSLDDQGRILPLSAEMRRKRSAALNRALDAIAETTDETDTEENWREALRDLDNQRPHRPLFEGMY